MPDGVQGPQGPQGYVGVQGGAGSTGSQGTGVQGVLGGQGYQGPQGNIGPQGRVGSSHGAVELDELTDVWITTPVSGEVIRFNGTYWINDDQANGPQGTQGVQGARGSQGPQGAQITGAQGSQGFQGFQGTQGVQGAQITGAQGQTGTAGSTGAQGAAGAQGAQGVQGLTGPEVQPLGTGAGPTFDHLHLADVAAITTAAESWVGPSSTAGIYFKGGYVGIGTTNPTAPLYIYKSASGALGGHIVLDNNGGAEDNSTAIIFGDNGGSGAGARGAISCTTKSPNSYSGVLEFKTGVAAYASLPTRMTILGNGNVVIHDGNVIVGTGAAGNVSAGSFTDRTPYPADKKVAYDAVLSLTGKDGQLDHTKLHAYVKAEGGRNLSALVSAQNEVIKDLLARIEVLEKK